MNPINILKDARKLLEKGFTKGVYHNPDFTKFCSIGALEHALDDNFGSIYDQPMISVYKQAQSALGKTIDPNCTFDYETIIEYNDTHTQEEVLAKFDEAIKSLESKEQC